MKSSKAFKRGGMAAVLIIAAVVIAVLLNVIITTVNNRFPFSIDLTAQQDYTINLDGEYEQYIKNIDKDISVTVCANEDDFEGTTYMNAMIQNCGLNISSSDAETVYRKYARQTLMFIKSFPTINGRIKVSFRDPNSVTDFTEVKNSYSSENLEYGDIIVSCIHKTQSGDDNNRYRIIKMTDIFATEVNQTLYNQLARYGSSYYNNLTGSNLAMEMTSALYTVSSESSVKVAVIGGHGAQTASGEGTALSGLKTLLSKNNYTFTDVASVLTDEIPEDASSVVLYQPTEDFTSEEISKISDYLINGGNYGKNLVYMASYSQPSMPNLEQFLSEWGIGVLPLIGYDEEHCYSAYTALLVEAADSDYTASFDSQNSIIYPDIYRLARRTFDKNGNRYTTPILTTYNSALGCPIDAGQDWNSSQATEKGPFDVMLMGSAYDSKANGEQTPASNVVYIGGSYTLNEQVLSQSSIYNSTLILNIFNGFAGVDQDSETAVNISPKVINTSNFASRLINNSAPTVMYIVFVGLIPVGLVAAGIVIWNRRRKRT